MKKLNIKYIIMLLMFFNFSRAFTQNDTCHIFYPNNISIKYYIPGKKPGVSIYEKINKLNFITDSTLRITIYRDREELLNINGIREITVKTKPVR